MISNRFSAASIVRRAGHITRLLVARFAFYVRDNGSQPKQSPAAKFPVNKHWTRAKCSLVWETFIPGLLQPTLPPTSCLKKRLLSVLWISNSVFQTGRSIVRPNSLAATTVQPFAPRLSRASLFSWSQIHPHLVDSAIRRNNRDRRGFRHLIPLTSSRNRESRRTKSYF